MQTESVNYYVIVYLIWLKWKNKLHIYMYTPACDCFFSGHYDDLGSRFQDQGGYFRFLNVLSDLEIPVRILSILCFVL